MADLGYLGVTFFFVLSGFVLTWSDTVDVGAAAFYRNRLARIYPLHLATLALALVIPGCVAAGGLATLQHLTLTQAWTISGAVALNPVSWSLSAELFFYLLLPVVLPLLRQRSGRELMLIMASAWLVQFQAVLLVIGSGMPQAHFLTYDVPLLRLPEFVTGVCLALLIRGKERPPVAVRGAVGVLAGLAGAAIVVMDLSGSPMGWGQASVLAVPAVVVCLWRLAHRDLADRRSTLASPLMQRLGSWSFALYLVHFLVLRLVAALLDWDDTGGHGFPTFVAILAISTALAAALHLWVEVPAERRLRTGRLPLVPRSTALAARGLSTPAHE